MERVFHRETDTVLSQMVYSIVAGIIFSCLSVSLLGVVFFATVIEGFAYFSLRKISKWDTFTRLSLFYGYVFGWIIGRTSYGMKTFFISEHIDSVLGI